MLTQKVLSRLLYKKNINNNHRYRPENCWEFKHEQLTKIYCCDDWRCWVVTIIPRPACRDPGLRWFHRVALCIDINVIVSPINVTGFKWQTLWHCPGGRENQCANISPIIKNRFHKLWLSCAICISENITWPFILQNFKEYIHLFGSFFLPRRIVSWVHSY